VHARYTVSGVSGVHIAAAQIAIGQPTSLIPTTSAAVTRAADLLAFTGANYTSWARPDEGSFLVEAALQAPNDSCALWALNDNTINNQMALIVQGGRARFVITAGGVTHTDLDVGAAPAPGSVFRLAGAYRAGEFMACLNGEAVVSSLGGDLPAMTQARLGAQGAGTDVMGGYLRRAAFYPAFTGVSHLQAISAL